MKKLFIILLITAFISSTKVWSPKELIEELQKEKKDEEFYKGAIKLINDQLKYYVYYSVVNDPPQPEGLSNYFDKIDIENLFSNITTKDINLYDFKNEFIKAVFKLKDFHMMPTFKHLDLNSYIYVAPVELYTKYNESTNETKMFARKSVSNYSHFNDGENVEKLIEQNKEIPIKKIKNESPFDYLQKFGNIEVKSPHGTYSSKGKIFPKGTLFLPLTVEDLTNFTIEYENEESLTTDFIIIDNKPSNSNELVYYDNIDDEKKFIEEINKKLLGDILFYFHCESIIDEVDKAIKPKSENKMKAQKKEANIKWDYEIENNIYCRVDDKNKVNVYKILTFGWEDMGGLEFVKNCSKIMDKNSYPIIIILSDNEGGSINQAEMILQLSAKSPILTRELFRHKKFENYEKVLAPILLSPDSPYKRIDKNEAMDLDYLNKGSIIEKYGNKENKLISPVYFEYNQSKLNELKKTVHHKRDSNEILIYTDGFSYSAASCFTKKLQNSGYGIIVGYYGNPKLDKELFDSGNSCSSLTAYRLLSGGIPEIINDLDKYGIGFEVFTATQGNYNPEEHHIPIEFDVKVVDERINYFNKYDDSEYEYFIEQGLIILEKYKSQCSKVNKLQRLFTDCKLPDNYKDKHLHGGNPCGENGKWDLSKCVPSYCDENYIFNTFDKSCVEDPFTMKKEQQKSEEKPKERQESFFEKNKTIIIICIISLVLLIILVVLFIFIRKKREKEHSISTVTINEGLMNNNEV